MTTNRAKIIICLSLAIAALVTFWQVRNHEFINLDDDLYVYENPHVKSGLTPENIKWAIKNLDAGFWMPLTWLTHILDCELYGLNPEGHHFSNLLLHMANTLLLFLVLSRMTSALWRSAFVAMLFAIHPLQIESVAWVTERKGILSGLFWMLTLWSYVYYAEKPGIKRYCLVLLFFGLGLLTKPMIVMLPVVLIFLDYWPLKRIRSDSLSWSAYHKLLFQPSNTHGLLWRNLSPVLEKIPLLVLSAASISITFFAETKVGALPSLESFPVIVRLSNALVSYATYLLKLICPIHLSVFYPHQGLPPLWKITGAALLLAALSFAAAKCRKTQPFFIIGWLWFLFALLPVIGFIQIGDHSMADRYFYIPCIGIFIIVSWGSHRTAAKFGLAKAHLFLLAAVVVFLLGVSVQIQLPRWRNSITLFKHALEVTRNNHAAHNNLAHALFHKGDVQGALQHASAAVRIKPNSVEIRYNMGVALASSGKLEEAISHLEWVLQADPDSGMGNYSMALALTQQGKFEQAIPYFLKSLESNGDHAAVHYHLGKIFFKQNRLEKAYHQYKEALRINPNYPEAHNDLGVILYEQGKPREAAFHISQALKLRPDFEDAQRNLDIILRNLKSTKD